MKRLFTVLVLLLSGLGLRAQDCPYDLPDGMGMETYTFAVKGQDTLKLDYFKMKDDCTARPTVVLSFGGGWFAGHRRSFPEVVRYVQKGYNAVCIDYRISLETHAIDHNKRGRDYAYAIRRAVEDTYDATRFILDNAERLGIDSDKLILSGCSAGAINSVMAEYWLCNGDTLATSRLPKDFNYAAVVSGAGGVWKMDFAKPEWKRTPCPHYFVHGTADTVVPFGELLAEDSGLGCFGPEALAPIFKEKGWSYETFFMEDGDHQLAAIPDFYLHWTGYMVDETHHIFDFLDRVVLGGEKLQIDYYERDYDHPRTNFLKHELVPYPRKKPLLLFAPEIDEARLAELEQKKVPYMIYISNPVKTPDEVPEILAAYQTRLIKIAEQAAIRIIEKPIR